jgi:dinuclear metal center YbgI/SA1388 family protein
VLEGKLQSVGGSRLKITDIIRDLEEIAPPRLADDGDNIGLQIGDASNDVLKVVVAVDPTLSVVDHAINTGTDLIICHHPLIYTPIKTLALGSPTADVIVKLIKAGISLYVMHTNYDAAAGGVNDVLAEVLGVRDARLLVTRHHERQLKVAVFTPYEALDKVRDAMAEAGAGVIGNYTHCSFRTEGTGTFKPLPEAQPYIGEIGKLEEALEYRLEMIVPEWKLSQVIDAMISVHPYEEVAYDVYVLANQPKAYGYGRIGRLENPMKLSDFRSSVEKALESHQIRMVGRSDKQVQMVAVCSGAGKSFISDAHTAGADVYVTADVGYHDFAAAEALGLAVIDAGHYETERPAMQALYRLLMQKYDGQRISVQFVG